MTIQVARATVLLMKLLYLIIAVAFCDGYPQGPPLSSCTDMFPEGHAENAQFTTAPYDILVNTAKYRPWDELRVTLRSSGKHYIRGFFLQARRADCSHGYKNQPVGTFVLKPFDHDFKAISCGATNNSLGHDSKSPKTSITVHWYAPASEQGHIYFRATVVEDRATFWTDVFSNVINDTTSFKQPEFCLTRKYLITGIPETSSTGSTTRRTTRRRQTTSVPTTRRPSLQTVKPKSAAMSAGDYMCTRLVIGYIFVLLLVLQT